MRRFDRVLLSAIGGFAVAAGMAQAQQTPVRVALVNDTEPVFVDYADERNLGFRLGLEYARSIGNLSSGQVVLEEVTVPASTWEDDVLPERLPMESSMVWIAPIQARKTHRIIQYGAERRRLVLVAATPATELPVTDNDLAFRTYFRWQDVDRELLEWSAPDQPVWVSAVQSGVQVPVGIHRIDVSPRSTGASTVDRLQPDLESREAPALVTSWPVLLDWLSVLQNETGLTSERTYVWLPDLGALTAMRAQQGVKGLTYYYYDLTATESNDWLVRTMLARHDRLPSHYVVAGMVAALALVEALPESGAGPATAAELAERMEGLEWQGPQGTLRMRPGGEADVPLFRTELQQQSQLEWARPVLID